MPFSGNVETIPLDEVFQFIATNSLDGQLTIAGGGARLTIHFEGGQLFFPFSAKRGTYSLGKILRQTGVLSREALEKHLDGARRSRLAELKALEGQASAQQIEDARRKQYEEEIQDAFLWRRAYFEFTPGPLPEEVQRERSQGKGVLLEPTAFLMEVARRTDERRRIRRAIPTAKAMLVTTPGREQEVAKALEARRIDVNANPFDGTRSLEELIDLWGVPHHDSLSAISPLVEGGALVPLPLDVAREAFTAALERNDGRDAARLCSHLVELDSPPANPFDLGPEQRLLTSPAFASEASEVALSVRCPGPRAFSILRLLVTTGVPFTAVAREDGREKRLSLSELQLSLTASSDDVTPPVARYLRKSGMLSEADFKAAAAQAEAEKRPIFEVLLAAGKVSEKMWLATTLEKVSDELAEIYLWREIELDVRNRARAFSGRGDAGALAIAMPMGEAERGLLKGALERWKILAEAVPGEDAIFLLGDRARDGDPAAKFFSRFDGRRTVGELRRVAKADSLEFIRFLYSGVRKGYAKAPTREDLGARLKEALAKQDDVRAYKVSRSGVVYGYGPIFQGGLESLKARDAAPSPDARPSIEGDMNGVGLASVLQGLRGRKRTGTLVLTDGKRETKIYFHRGQVFLLRIEDAAAEEFVNFFLEGSDESAIEFAPQVDARGIVVEADLDAAEARRLKDQVLDVLFWDNATFTFWKNDLPDEFFEPGTNTTKVGLDTDGFLMEAIGRIQEWDRIRQVIPSGSARLSFVSPEAKFEAIREKGMAEVLTLVDGRKTFEDVVRISGQPRLEIGRLFRGLVQAEQVRVLEAEAAPTPTG